MPKKVKSSVTRFLRLPLAYRLQLLVFHVFQASVGKCAGGARTMTQSCSSPPPPPHAFTSRLPSFLAKSSDVIQLSFHNGIFFFIA